MDTKKTKVTDIIFIRHAESYNNTLYNVIKQKYGDGLSDERIDEEEARLRQADSDLSDVGRIQASQLGKFIKETKLSMYIPMSSSSKCVIITSPMLRCLLTCKEVATALNTNAVVVPNLFESGGCYDHADYDSTKTISRKGLSKQAIADRFGYECYDDTMDGGWYHLDGKETREQFWERVDAVANWLWSIHNTPINDRKIGSVHSFTHIIVVAHGNLLSGIINKLTSNTLSSGIISHCNTGISHLQLYTSIIDGVDNKLGTIKCINRVDHLDKNLIIGNEMIEDHWIQEFYF